MYAPRTNMRAYEDEDGNVSYSNLSPYEYQEAEKRKQQENRQREIDAYFARYTRQSKVMRMAKVLPVHEVMLIALPILFVKLHPDVVVERKKMQLQFDQCTSVDGVQVELRRIRDTMIMPEGNFSDSLPWALGNKSSNAFPYALRVGDGRGLKLRLERSQRDIDQMISEDFSLFQRLYAQWVVPKGALTYPTTEMEVERLDELLDPGVVEVRPNGRGGQLVGDIDYDKTEKGVYVAHNRDNVDVVFFDSENLYYYDDGGLDEPGHVCYPDDSVGAAVRYSHRCHGIIPKGLKKMCIIPQGKRGEVPLHLFFAPMSDNIGVDVIKVSLRNVHDYYVKKVMHFVDGETLMKVWSRTKTEIYFTGGQIPGSKRFTRAVKSGGGVGQYLMQKKGIFF